jgi:hypothetical protein
LAKGTVMQQYNRVGDTRLALELALYLKGLDVIAA